MSEEVKNIAYEYVRQHQVSAEEAYYENKQQIELEDVLPILEWLSKDYCIVLKSKAVELQVDALKRCTSQDFYDGAIYAYEKIFGSELFDQKGENNE